MKWIRKDYEEEQQEKYKRGKCKYIKVKLQRCQTCYKEHTIQESNCVLLCPEEEYSN